GEVSPSGKLPFTVMNEEDEYPFFDKDADEIDYGPLHGYTLAEKNQITPAYAFGHGLTYTTFDYRALKARRTRDGIEAQVSITNTGNMRATEVAQLYIGFPGKAVERPLKLLRGFERVDLTPGETKSAHFFVPNADLSYWNEAAQEWQIEPGIHSVFAGGSSSDSELKEVTVRL
ncbi:MAG: fibronectin type III-like domain-contianing protein, partial [Pseudomonadota bacterium]